MRCACCNQIQSRYEELFYKTLCHTCYTAPFVQYSGTQQAEELDLITLLGVTRGQDSRNE